MLAHSPVLLDHLRRASHAYDLYLAKDARWALVKDFALPAGYNAPVIQVLLGIPPDYPMRPPGLLPHGIFITPGLLYHGRTHPNIIDDGYELAPERWSWLCLRCVAWDPCRDDIVRCLELVREVLSNP